MAKEQKTNAMRILDKNKIAYTVNTYECDEFIDGVTIADMLGQPYESSYKTLVAVGKSGGHYVFVLPIAAELDLKVAARTIGEKAVELIHVKELFALTGYIRGGCSPIGMKKTFPTYIDASAERFEKITVSAGVRGAQLLLCARELISFVCARCEDLTEKTVSP